MVALNVESSAVVKTHGKSPPELYRCRVHGGEFGVGSRGFHEEDQSLRPNRCCKFYGNLWVLFFQKEIRQRN